MNMQSSNLGSAHYAPQNYGRQGSSGNISGGGSSSNSTYSGVGGAGGGGSGGLHNRSGEEEFVMESDDFPALPGSSSSSAQQKPSGNSGNVGTSRNVGNNGVDVGNGNKDQQQLLNRGLSGMASSHLSVGAGNSMPSGSNSKSGSASQSYFSGGSGSSSILDAPSGAKGGSGVAGTGGATEQQQQQNKPISSSDLKSIAAAVTLLQQRYQQQMAHASPKDLKFGMGGLLEIIKSSENSGADHTGSNSGDRDVSVLALGSDLTTFGLNLNSQDPLFPKFLSPFNDQPIMAPNPPFNVPQCYVSHPPTLKAEHLLKVQLETLFHMFYTMPRDILQAYAAQELYRRSWRFHETLKLWLKKRVPDEVAQSNTPNMPWACFDVSDWQVKSYTPPPQSGADVTSGFLSEEAVRVKGGSAQAGAPIAAGSNIGGAQNNGPPVTVGGGAMVQPNGNGQYQQQQQPPPGGGVVGGHHS